MMIPIPHLVFVHPFHLLFGSFLLLLLRLFAVFSMMRSGSRDVLITQIPRDGKRDWRHALQVFQQRLNIQFIPNLP